MVAPSKPQNNTVHFAQGARASRTRSCIRAARRPSRRRRTRRAPLGLRWKSSPPKRSGNDLGVSFGWLGFGEGNPKITGFWVCGEDGGLLKTAPLKCRGAFWQLGYSYRSWEVRGFRTYLVGLMHPSLMIYRVPLMRDMGKSVPCIPWIER